MNDTIRDLALHIRELQTKLEDEIEKNLGLYEVEFRKKIACFRRDVVARQRAFKLGLVPFLFSSKVRHILVAPVIYSMILPMVLLDLWVSLYQAICFPAYGIPRVKRSHYVVFDRHHLAYLNLVEKMNCVYCSYGNGVFAYARAVAGRTEQYWCPIKHARRVLDPHGRYFSFLDYGDAEGYRAQLARMREDARQADAAKDPS